MKKSEMTPEQLARYTEYQHRWNEEHKEYRKEYRKAYMVKWEAEHKELRKAYRAKWEAKRKEYRKAYRAALADGNEEQLRVLREKHQVGLRPRTEEDREKARAYAKAYYSKPENKAKARAYYSNPENKIKAAIRLLERAGYDVVGGEQ